MTASVMKSVSAASALLLTAVMLIVIVVSGQEVPGCAVPAPMGQGTTSGTDGARDPVSLAGYDSKQLELARQIVAVGEQRQIPESGILAALMAASTESGLKNYANSGVPDSLSYPHDAVGSDHDSVGPFQLRVSIWSGQLGGMAQLMNPLRQIGWFYDQLLAVEGWQTRDPADLAQAVERSAYPDAYATKREAAHALHREFRGAAARTPATPGVLCELGPASGVDGPQNGSGGSDFGKRVLAAGMRGIGLPYVWGGGDATGPTGGGFDCSGLTLFAVAQASEGQIVLGHYTGDQQRDSRGAPVALDRMQPGDLIYFTSPGEADSHHTGIYAGLDPATGEPQLLNAPTFGIPVQVQPLSDFASDRMDVRRFGAQQQDSRP
ncbi:C40 family peptidase [Nocardia yunnanensis]|nr:NlpC/P60 family protein [Nocardia yunnanensis]